ncbi:MAG: hypothetical protein B7733_22480 [Myxococcales bacterium FL481]|nr:MAG: hypothetical protein B7733_22480 [Myxococcales bacterium FL481]
MAELQGEYGDAGFVGVSVIWQNHDKLEPMPADGEAWQDEYGLQDSVLLAPDDSWLVAMWPGETTGGMALMEPGMKLNKTHAHHGEQPQITGEDIAALLP